MSAKTEAMGMQHCTAWPCSLFVICLVKEQHVIEKVEAEAMYHARVLAASHSIYSRVVTEGAPLYTDCPKNSLSPLLQGQPGWPGVLSRTKVPAHRRDQLACVIRYTARGAVALERLEEVANGNRRDPLQTQ
jgi:hypothetical protein